MYITHLDVMIFKISAISIFDCTLVIYISVSPLIFCVFHRMRFICFLRNSCFTS